MKPGDIEDLYRLSPMQEGMLFHHLYSPESDIYFRQQGYTFHGPLNIPAFTRAWDRVIERHAVLRASFFWQDLDKPVQVVRRTVATPLEYQDWRGLSEAEQDERLKALLLTERETRFDITRAPLMRILIVQVADEVSHFIWSYHHLLMDGWSKYHVLREVVSLYDAFCEGKDLQLGRPRSYRDYISWLKHQDKSGTEAFWRDALRGFKAPTPIGGAQRNGGPNSESEYSEREVWLNAETTSALKSLAKQHQFTLNTLMQGAWSLLLSRYSGEEDVLFGVTVSGRPASLPGVESMVGLFINTLPLRVRVPHDAELLPWLKRLQAQQAELSQFEHSPLSDVHGWSEVPRSQMLFESILVFDNFPFDENVRTHRELRFTPLASVERNNYPLTLVAFADERMMLRIPYDTQRFESAAVDRMLGHLQSLLEGMAANPHQRLCELPLVTRAEREQLLSDLDHTEHDLWQGLTVHALFEAQVERTPDATAVRLGPESLTYRELNERANQLAHHLRSMGVGPEVRVGICAERSIEMLVGLLGTLKAGGVYVPLDPSYPQERLSYLLEDLAVPVLLTQDHLLFELPPYAAASQIVCLDSDWATISSCSSDNPENLLSDENLAYIIYTSGSSGTPKGVCISHGVAANHFLTAQREFRTDANDVVLEFASFNFDVSLEQIFVPLLAGATLVLRDSRTWGREDFFQHVAEYGLTIVNIPPAYWTQIVPAPGSDVATELAARLKLVIIGGDQMQPHTARMWQQAGLRDVRLLNAYGPTETTITATAFEVPLLADENGARSQMPIGRPLVQRAIYILDGQGSPVPVGVTGELHIGGPLLARGYLNQPGLTAEKFIPDPFSQQPGARMYRTGDQASYSEDGNIRFLGRVDRQVKIRGYRIELGEIEAALYACEGVRDAAVIVSEQANGEKQLTGYLVMEAGAAVDKVRERLRERLPEYMIPSVFMLLEEMPLTPNGKIDRRALPAPDEARARDVDDYQAPRTPIEEMLADIFAGVLEVEHVGVEENFFELGGHSLLVTQVISRIRESLNVELSVRAIFEYPTVATLAAQVEAESRAGREAPPLLVRRESGVALPLSFAQQRLWFLDQFEPGSSAYNMPFALRLKGVLDVAALERAMTEVIRRHEVLRTRFVVENGEPVQVVDEPAPFVLSIMEVGNGHVEQLIQKEASQSFDLEAGPLVRARLLKLDERDQVLLFTMHHIVSDGWSMGVLIREVGALYNAYRQGEESPLAELPIQYADYAVWQREWLRGEALERQLEYWRRQLTDAPVLELLTEKARPAVLSPASARADVRLSAEVVAGLRALGRQEGCTLFMTLLAALQIVLWRYTGQSDLVVGTPVANRGQGGTEGLIGFFVNTLALRTGLEGALTFRELLARVRETCLGAYAHQDVPFEKLVEELGVRRDLNRHPLFDVMLALQGGSEDRLRLEGLEVDAEAVGSGAVGAKFDLLLGLVEERGGGVRGKLEYRKELFGEDLMRRMAGRLVQVVEEVAACRGESRLKELGTVRGEERSLQLVEWNATARDYNFDGCLHQLFERQTARTPDATALVCGGERLSYRELDTRANQLANQLNALGVGPETVVGLLFERSTELVVSLLGVLKAGGAYLPLDPSYPAARLRYMFEDAAPRVLLTTEALLSQWDHVGPQSQADVLCVEQLELSEDEAPAPVSSGVEANHLAYVIYTSGSTGRPKGAMNTHRAIVNRLLWMQEAYGLEASDRVLQKTPYSFDVSVWEFFWPLITGATLVVAPPDLHRDSLGLSRLITAERVTTIHFVPSMLAVFLDEPETSGCAGVLRRVICSGEALSADLMERCFTRLPGVELHNLYGPTEAAVDVTAWHCERRADGRVPLGVPVANTQMYVLDERLELVGPGVAGALYIGGVQVGRGYLRRPELTAERFVADPYSNEPGARMYWTGDVGRWMAEGQLEYLGRADEQVKLRGQRIELGEIEATLRDCEGVRDAAVVVSERADGEKRLVGYVVTETATNNNIKEYLRERLPEYMVPSTFVRLEELPLTPSGKLDRRALPAPESVIVEAVDGYVAPRTPVAELLAQTFAEVLGVEEVGADESFFDLGGHSLLATKVVSRVREAFRVEIALRALFERPTVAQLARHIEACLKAGEVTTVPPIRRVKRDGVLPLSFAQQRLWFFEQLQPGSATYNLLQSVQLLGALNVPALEQSLNEILRRHESLRTTFQNIKGEPAQQVMPASLLALPLTDLSGLPELEREAEVRRLTLEELNRPFDLARGPLVRARLLKLDAETHVALFMMHHIVTDAWSMGVLLRELKVLYEAFSEDRPSPLADLPIQYVDFAHWQREWLSGAALEEQLGYWQERLGGELSVLTLPADRPRPDVWTYRGAKHPVKFSKELTEELKAFSNRQGATLFMTLLAAFQVLLHYYTGAEDIVVGTDDANRSRLETEPLIGFFINQLALRTDLSGNPRFRELLGRVREVTLGAYANHDLPFDKIVERLQPERSLARVPLFQVKLVLQNTPVEELELRGLKLLPLQVDYAAAKFDLTPLLWEKPDGLRGWFEYSTDLFSSAAVARIVEQFEIVLKSVAARSNLTLEQLREVLAEDDRERRARAQREREESQRSRFKTVRPKAISLSEQTVVQTSEIVPGERLPLVVQPATNNLDLESWSRANLGFIETNLQKHGAILFRGFDVNSASVFEGFAHAICPRLFDENGEHNRGSISGKVYTPVSYPANKLLLWHNENSFNDSWPMKIWFCCATPAEQGGETPLVDSRRVFQMLDPKIRERFIEKKVMYVRNYKEGLGQSWQAIMRAENRADAEKFCRNNLMEFEWKEDNGLLTRCVRPAVAKHPRTGEMVWFNQAQHWHRACLDAETRESLRALYDEEDFPRNCYYGDGSVIEDSIMEEILEVYRQLEVSFPWQEKDVVMLDNLLTAHGRNPYVGKRRLYVAMGEMTSYADLLSTETASSQSA
jgi:amino acid adenylation domain-containing protein